MNESLELSFADYITGANALICFLAFIVGRICESLCESRTYKNLWVISFSDIRTQV
jgi:hypothetical protein